MGTAPRKQLASQPTPRAPVDLAPFFTCDSTSEEGKKTRTAKMDAEKLAEDLIRDNKINLLVNELVQVHSAWYKLKNNIGRTEAFYGMKEDVRRWADHMVKSGDVEGIKSSYIYSAVRLCYLQLDLAKAVAELP